MTLRSYFNLALKETYHLLPIIIVLMALDFLSLLDSLFAQSPDELSWTDFSLIITAELSSISSNVYVLVGIIAGYQIFSSERRQQTQAFLWALPIARHQLFWCKIVSVILVLVLYITFSQIISWWSQSFTASTIEARQFSWELWWLELVLIIGTFAIGICYGALTSYFRTAGIILLGFAWVCLSTVATLVPFLGFVSIGALFQPEYYGEKIILSYKAWLFHSLLAGFCLLNASYLWIKHSEPKQASTSKPWLQSRFVTVALYLFGFISLFAYMVTSTLPRKAFDTAERPPLTQLSTEQFLYSFYLQDQSAVLNLSEATKNITAAVQTLLGTSIDQQILVDITDDNADHLGIAGWRRLRMNRKSLYIPSESRHIFTHEMTHVLADQASKRRLTEHSAYTQFFNEGLAEWVSYRILNEADLTASHDALMLLAATAWQRLDMEFNDFLFANSFATQFDQFAVYAFGLAWVESLSTVCGEQAPGAVLQAMASPDLPQRIQGRLFWQTILQDSQCDLASVNTQFALDMAELQPSTEAVPKVVGRRDRSKPGIIFSLQFENPELENSYSVYVRVRDNAQAGPNGIHTFNGQLSAGNVEEISIPLSRISGERFQYQIGVEFINGERPFYGRWISDG